MDEKTAKFHTNLGIEKTNQGDYQGAIEEFDKAIELNPTWALTYFSKGIALHYQRKIEEAYENYSKAIVCDEKMIDAYYNRAHILLLDEKPSDETLQKALSDLEKALEIDKNFIDAYYYSAVVKMKLKNYQGALDDLDKLLTLEPDAIQSKALKKLIIKKYL